MTRRSFLSQVPAWLSVPLLLPTPSQAQTMPQPMVGRVERLSNFPSKFVDARHVDVWLPPDYDATRRYQALYMHDGQMLFDARTTWNKKAWHADAVAAGLISLGLVHDFIIVGPWSNGQFRHSEYFPAKFLPHLPEPLRQGLVKQGLLGRSQSDAYLRFLVEELKPAIDARYATRTEREATFVMGSSMGGLISAYALCEHTSIFGGAACMSTHWIGTFERNDEVPRAAMAYLRGALPEPSSVKLWMDRGTAELDAQYDPAQSWIDTLMTEKGFVRGARYQSQVYEGAGHSEVDWAKRLRDPLVFLLGR